MADSARFNPQWNASPTSPFENALPISAKRWVIRIFSGHKLTVHLLSHSHANRAYYPPERPSRVVTNASHVTVGHAPGKRSHKLAGHHPGRVPAPELELRKRAPSRCKHPRRVLRIVIGAENVVYILSNKLVGKRSLPAFGCKRSKYVAAHPAGDHVVHLAGRYAILDSVNL